MNPKPTDRPARVCVVDGCRRAFHSAYDGNDYCSLHYNRIYRGRPVGDAEPELHYEGSAASVPADQLPQCSVTACPDRAKTRGMCTKHYQRLRKHGDTETVKTRRINEGDCLVGDCPHPAYVRGYCTKHYQRFKKYGDPIGPAAINAAPECSEPGCTKKPKSRGLCSAHYEAQRVAAKS